MPTAQKDPATPAAGRNGRGEKNRVQKRRQEIIDAAAQVFFERGYDASSTQDIADAVGILKGSLYYYVESKEEFLYEVIKEAHDLGLEILEQVSELDGDVLHRITELIRRHVRYYADNVVKTSVYFREYRSLSEEHRRQIDRFGHAYRHFVADLIREGQRDGSVSTSIDPALSGVAIVEMLNSIPRWYHEGGRATADQVADQYATIIVGGVATHGAVEQRGGESRFRAGLVRTPVKSTKRPLKGRATAKTR